jgi:transcriptional antiterminator
MSGELYTQNDVLLKIFDSINQLSLAVNESAITISNSLDEIEERLRRINESINTHTEEVRMIDVKNRTRD